jgi:UDP-N-acetylglucosamine 3-dehydrogenase
VNGASAGLDARRIYRSWEDLRAQGEIDFAVVALPAVLHDEAAVRIASDGVHVLVEKPLALTERGARSIVEACDEADVLGAVGHVERYNPSVVELKRLLGGGAIGRPIAITSERAGPLPTRGREGGVINDLATHDLDLIPWLVHARIELVFAQTESPAQHVAAITGRLSGGIVFNTVTDWLSRSKLRRLRVLGDEGSLVADLMVPRLMHIEEEIREIPLEQVEPLVAQFGSFCDLLEGRTDSPVVSLEEGLNAVANADAAVRSAREGRPITL